LIVENCHPLGWQFLRAVEVEVSALFENDFVSGQIEAIGKTLAALLMGRNAVHAVGVEESVAAKPCAYSRHPIG